METETDYQNQANDFLIKTGTTMKTFKLGHFPYFEDDNATSRDVWRITLIRKHKVFSFEFGQSIDASAAGIKPTAYDVLACLTTYEPGTFENFCGDYGYSEDSRKAEKVYKAVVKEFAGVNRLFSDVIEDLA